MSVFKLCLFFSNYVLYFQYIKILCVAYIEEALKKKKKTGKNRTKNNFCSHMQSTWRKKAQSHIRVKVVGGVFSFTHLLESLH